VEGLAGVAVVLAPQAKRAEVVLPLFGDRPEARVAVELVG
jgi:hypothetical protein